jgi:hypothetical protein
MIPQRRGLGKRFSGLAKQRSKVAEPELQVNQRQAAGGSRTNGLRP